MRYLKILQANQADEVVEDVEEPLKVPDGDVQASRWSELGEESLNRLSVLLRIGLKAKDAEDALKQQYRFMNPSYEGNLKEMELQYLAEYGPFFSPPWLKNHARDSGLLDQVMRTENKARWITSAENASDELRLNMGSLAHAGYGDTPGVRYED